MLFEMSCKKLNPDIDRSITLEKYTEIWLQTIAPDKLAKSTLVREKQDIERFKPYLGSYVCFGVSPVGGLTVFCCGLRRRPSGV